MESLDVIQLRIGLRPRLAESLGQIALVLLLLLFNHFLIIRGRLLQLVFKFKPSLIKLGFRGHLRIELVIYLNF